MKMPGGNAPRRKGDNFERRVKKHLQDLGLFCVRQPRSTFPDLIAIRKKDILPITYCIECKMNKYITKNERVRLELLGNLYFNYTLIAYKDNKNICFCNLDYNKFTF